MASGEGEHTIRHQRPANRAVGSTRYRHAARPPGRLVSLRRTLLLVGLMLVAGAPAVAQIADPPPPADPTPSPTSIPAEIAPIAEPPGPETNGGQATGPPMDAPVIAPPAEAGGTDPAPPLSRERRRDRYRRPHMRRHDRREELREVGIVRSCAPFTHTQTYLTWGPALAYGEPVTVTYAGDRCTRPMGTRANVIVNGSAAVYQGILVEGEPIDSRPFRMTGSWNRPSNEIAWPPPWWRCGVKSATYTWEIPGVYSFDVGARWGVWTLTVATQALTPLSEARTVHWTYNGC